MHSGMTSASGTEVALSDAELAAPRTALSIIAPASDSPLAQISHSRAGAYPGGAFAHDSAAVLAPTA